MAALLTRIRIKIIIPSSHPRCPSRSSQWRLCRQTRLMPLGTEPGNKAGPIRTSIMAVGMPKSLIVRCEPLHCSCRRGTARSTCQTTTRLKTTKEGRIVKSGSITRRYTSCCHPRLTLSTKYFLKERATQEKLKTAPSAGDILSTTPSTRQVEKASPLPSWHPLWTLALPGRNSVV